MNIPIKIALNFLFNAGKAEKSIGGMGRSFEMMNQTYAAFQKNMANFAKTKLNLNNTDFIKFGSVLKGVEEQLIKEMGAFGKTNTSFNNMIRGMEFERFTKGIDTMTSTMKKFYPEMNLGSKNMLKIAEAFAEIRKTGKMANKTLDKITENFSNLDKYVKNPKEIKFFQDLFEEFEKSPKAAADVLKLNDAVDQFVKKKKAVDGLKSAFQNVFGLMPNGTEFLWRLARAAGAFTAFSDAAEAQDRMVRTMSSMGMMANKSADLFQNLSQRTKELGTFTDAVGKVAGNTQVKFTEATEAMSQLFSMRIIDPGNFKDAEALATTTIRMSQAFGVTTEEAAQFAKSLKVIGGLGIKDIQGAVDEVANMQQQLGLTAQEAGEVINQIGFMTRRMTTFGGKVKDIQIMTKNVAKLGITFEKAGLSAQDANEMLNKMLDPSKIEDNVLLYQGLGMTVQDGFKMMTGDGAQFNNMSERMIDLAKKLQAQYGQSPLALQAMAEAYGMSLEQVSALSKMTKEQIAEQKESANLEAQAAKARESMKKATDKIMAALNVIIQAFIMPLINFITPIITFIGDLIGGINSFIDSLGAAGGVIKFVLGAVMMVLLLGIGKQIFSLIPGIGGIAKAFGGVGSAIGGVAGKFKDFVANVLSNTKPGGILSKIGSFLGGGGKKPPTPSVPSAPQAPGGAGGGKSGFIEQLSKLKPQQILAVGAALLMIGAAIALVVLAMTELMKVIKGMSAGEIIGGLAILIVIMAGFIIMVFLLGKVASSSAGPLIALGFAMLLIGIAIATVIVAMALLMNTLKGMSGPEIIGGLAALLIIFGGMIAMMIIMGIVGYTAGAGIIFVGLGLLMAGLAAVLMAIAFMIIVQAMILLGQNAGIVVLGLLTLIGAFFLMIPAVLLFAFAVTILVGAFFLLFLGSLLLIPTLLILMGAIVLFAILTWATAGLSANFYNMGLGLKMIAENASAAIAGLTELKAAFDSLGTFGDNFAKQMNVIADALFRIALMSPVIAIIALLMPKIMPSPTTGEGEVGPGGAETSRMEELLAQSNEKLDRIATNTKDTVDILWKIHGQGGPRTEPQVNVAGIQVRNG